MAALTPGAALPAFFGDSTPTSTVSFSSGSSSWYTFIAQSGPLLLMQHSHPTVTFKHLILFPSICIFSLCILTTASCLWLFFFTSCFLFPSLTFSGFFNGMLGVFKPGALNYYTLFRLILLTLFISRNLTSIYLPLFRSLASLLCDLMALTPNLVFFLLMSQTLAAPSSFSSSRAYSSLSFLPPLCLRFTPTLIM